ncbi:MAG: hypothetical protein O7G85_03710 [Planctomycetota bacterium]|nr:hypothetical protein [Planctomycetota bacterium]
MPTNDKTDQRMREIQKKLVFLDDDVKTLKRGLEKALEDAKGYIDELIKKQNGQLKALEGRHNTFTKNVRDFNTKRTKSIEGVHDDIVKHVKKRDKALEDRIKTIEKQLKKR